MDQLRTETVKFKGNMKEKFYSMDVRASASFAYKYFRDVSTSPRLFKTLKCIESNIRLRNKSLNNNVILMIDLRT